MYQWIFENQIYRLMEKTNRVSCRLTTTVQEKPQRYTDLTMVQQCHQRLL